MTMDIETLSDSELNDVILGTLPDDTSDTSDTEPSEEDTSTEEVDDTETEEADTEESEEDDVEESEEQTESEEEDETSDDTDDTETSDDEKATEDEEEETEPEIKLHPLKANGKEYEIESLEELYKLASAGVGAQKKFQAIASYRKPITTAEKLGIDLTEAINLAASLKENPEAVVKELMKQHNIDFETFEDDENNPNQSEPAIKDYTVSDFEAEYNEIVKELGDTPEFQQVQDILVNKWDAKSRETFVKDPTLIKGLYEEMLPLKELNNKSIWDIVYPEYEKLKLFKGFNKPDLELYMEAREKKLKALTAHEETKQQAKQQKKAKVTAKKKKAAITTGNKANNTISFEDMSDEELEAFILKHS